MSERSWRSTDREILRLAVPAFAALVSEPMFLLADSAIVGHLGTPELGALGIGSAVMGTLLSLTIFLAYGTTGAVARRMGTGDRTGAMRLGVDGLWLAGILGLGVTVIGAPLAGVITSWFGATPAVHDLATTWTRIALLGAIPMLVVLASTGVLRGMLDTRTPMVVAIGGNVLNAGLNWLLVYPLGLGIAGSAIGTTVAQFAMAIALVVVVARAARKAGAPLTPSLLGVTHAGRAGVPLIVRTVCLRASLLLMVAGATSMGEPQLATMQLAMTIWTFLAFTLDAVAIAAQAITGRSLGSGQADATRAVTTRMIRWGWVSGLVTGLALALVAPLLGPLFTGDPVVRDLLVPVLFVAALVQPVAGIVFVLDGVLIGAGDTVYLAWGQLVVLAAFAPVAVLVTRVTGDGTAGLTWLWVSFGVCFMGARAVVLLRRARTDHWLRLGT